MYLNGDEASNDIEKANMFAKYLKSVYVQHSEDPELENFIQQRNPANCYTPSFSAASIHPILCSMDLNKGSGHDGVSSLFLRECAEFLAQPLSDIFSRSIEGGCFPDALKIGQVTPIFKNGKKSEAVNYRGV